MLHTVLYTAPPSPLQADQLTEQVAELASVRAVLEGSQQEGAALRAELDTATVEARQAR